MSKFQRNAYGLFASGFKMFTVCPANVSRPLAAPTGREIPCGQGLLSVRNRVRLVSLVEGSDGVESVDGAGPFLAPRKIVIETQAQVQREIPADAPVILYEGRHVVFVKHGSGVDVVLAAGGQAQQKLRHILALRHRSG